MSVAPSFAADSFDMAPLPAANAAAGTAAAMQKHAARLLTVVFTTNALSLGRASQARSSNAFETRSSFSSSKPPQTNCTPTGSPSFVKPAGTDAAHTPARDDGMV